MYRVLSLAFAFSCADRGSDSVVVFVADDDIETFVDREGNGIEVTCSGDERHVTVEMKRGWMDEDLGPRFHVRVRLAGADEGVTYDVDRLDHVDVGYHDGGWPTEVGLVTVDDWVGVAGGVDRIGLTLSGVGDLAGENWLDATIVCVD